MTPEERAQRMAAAVTEAGTLVFSRGNIKVQITGLGQSGGTVTIDATVTQGNKPLPIDLPIHIVNPPLLVPDDAGPVERRDEEGNLLGRYREDPVAALQEILIGLVQNLQGGVR